MEPTSQDGKTNGSKNKVKTIMPTYDFLNKNTGEYEEHLVKISEYDQFKLDNPHLERAILSAPGCVDPITAGIRKPAAGFRELLRNMKTKVGSSNTIKD
jgi:hypothetical protein